VDVLLPSMLASFTAAAMVEPGQKKKPPARKVRRRLSQAIKRTQAELWGGKMQKADEWAKKLEFREEYFNIENMAELSHENASVNGSAITGIRALEGLKPYERGLIPSASSVNQVNRDMAAGFSDTIGMVVDNKLRVAKSNLKKVLEVFIRSLNMPQRAGRENAIKLALKWDGGKLWEHQGFIVLLLAVRRNLNYCFMLFSD
jgi:hypothetical protein